MSGHSLEESAHMAHILHDLLVVTTVFLQYFYSAAAATLKLFFLLLIGEGDVVFKADSVARAIKRS